MRVFKSLISAVKLLLSFGLALVFVTCCCCAIISYQYTSFSATDQSEVISKYQSVETTSYLYTDRSAEALMAAEKIDQYVSDLPSELSEEFVAEWKVVIASDVVHSYPDSVGGVTLWNSKLILIRSQSDPAVSCRLFVHEFGHFFDMSNSFHSYSQEFQKLYELYRNTFIEEDACVLPEYSTSSPQEFFAAVFKEYYLYSDYLLQKAPDAYQYIEKSIQNAVLNNSCYHTAKNNIIAFYRLQKSASQQ